MSSQARCQVSGNKCQTAGIFSVTCYLLPVLFLTACGFKAVYGQQVNESGTTNSAQLASIRIDHMDERTGQEFKEDLEDQLNPGGFISAAPSYRLHVTLTTVEGAIGTSRDGTVSRYNVYLNSSYALFRIADNVQVTGGTLNHVSSYNNVINAYFSTYISDQDATKRGIAELAEIYRARLSAYFDQGAPIQKTATPTPMPAGNTATPNATSTNPFNSMLPNPPPAPGSGYR